jgi:hypothetical protein
VVSDEESSEQAIVLKGHAFSRAASGAQSTRALAPEGMSSEIELNQIFLAAQRSVRAHIGGQFWLNQAAGAGLTTEN